MCQAETSAYKCIAGNRYYSTGAVEGPRLTVPPDHPARQGRQRVKDKVNSKHAFTTAFQFRAASLLRRQHSKPQVGSEMNRLTVSRGRTRPESEKQKKRSKKSKKENGALVPVESGTTAKTQAKCRPGSAPQATTPRQLVGVDLRPLKRAQDLMHCLN